ncbi:septation protein SpoVG family protein [Candidatus Saccharibacteria bacterium]|nr:septation protein SpoVG family protein [Candidatus Saccharibacteria bacterium]
MQQIYGKKRFAKAGGGDEMKLIDEIQLTPVHDHSTGILAFATFLLYGTIYCDSIALMLNRSGGYYLSYPTKPDNRGIKRGLYYPVKPTIANKITEAVVAKYESLMNDRHDSSQSEFDSVQISRRDIQQIHAKC